MTDDKRTDADAVLSSAGFGRIAPAQEKPILFSAPMLRALLAGSKTQTRREMRVQPHDGAEVVCDDFYPTVITKNGDEEPGPEVFGAWWSDGDQALRCPYGKPGDRLWVKETFAVSPQDGSILYAADSQIGRVAPVHKPSIFMPRTASRITLEITHVRVERLQDISKADALREGVVELRDGFGLADTSHFHAADPRQSYWSLWESINGQGSVEANPWVWVVEFQRSPDLRPNV